MSERAQTWHHGLVARWWAEFNVDGPEIAYFRRFVERGQPALDVACGSGRLLVPYVEAGLDVDGCDVSADMVALCRETAAARGLSPTVFVQAMHELEPPRSYRTIFVCGGFGLGSTREQDFEALRRFRRFLEPGGALVLDNEAPHSYRRHWPYWIREARGGLPTAWEDPGDRRRASDGSDLALRTRLVDLDPLAQRVALEIRAEQWCGETLVADEQHTLTMNLYFRNELLLMLDAAGFADLAVYGDHTEDEATGDHDFHVFVARKPYRLDE
jgi:SAM-dependent methyltransferase